MPRSGSKRCRRKRAPRRSRSKTAKIEPRCGCCGKSQLLTRSSLTDVPFARGHGLRHKNDAGHDQQDRPELADAVARVLADEKKYAYGDEHHRSHQSADPAVGAGAACSEVV